MADTKISALTALVAGDIQHTSDVVAIVDTSVTTTKKATAQAVVNAVLAQNTDTTVTGTINQTTIPTSKTLLVSTDIGSTVQGYDAQLADVAGLAVTDGNFIVGNGTNFVAESGSTARTSLGLGTGDSPEFTAVNIGSATDTTVTRVSAGVIAVEGSNVLLASNIGTSVQAYDAQLADVAGLAVTDGNFIVGNGTNFVAESGATARTSLGLGTGDSPEFTAVNIGSATDTTITRSSAGVIAVEGSNVLMASNIGTTVQGYDADTAKLDVAQTFTAAQTFNNPTVFSAGTASLPSITFTGDTNTGIFSPAADTIAFAEGGVEAMRIDSSGNVGIGQTSPQFPLHITGASGVNTYVHFTNATTGNTASDGFSIGVANGASDAYIIQRESAPLIFYTGATDRARIGSSGGLSIVDGLGVGTSTIFTSSIFFASSVVSAGAGTYPLKWNSSTGIVTYDTSSRLVKENIEDSPYGLAEVMQLQPRKYFRTDDQKDEIGFVADEVENILPEFVPLVPKSLFTKNEEDEELVAGGVNYEKLTAVLTKAIQELKAELDTVKAELATLKGN